MAASETVYSVSAGLPRVLARGRDQRTRFVLYDDTGAVVVPSSVTYTLLGPGDVEIVTGPATLTAGVAHYDLDAADLPDSLDYGERYAEVWAVAFGGTEGTRPYRRAVTLGRFELAPPLGQAELVAGAYPDLGAHLVGPLAGSLGDVIAEAWAHVLRTCWRQGTPGTVIVESGDLYDWFRELALSRIFAALYAADPLDRWLTLRDDHRAAAKAAAAGVRLVTDTDSSGTADDAGRRNIAGVVHVNGANRRRWSRYVGRRW